MKNTLAENLLRFGVKNLTLESISNLEQIAEQTPAGSTMTPEAQVKMDKMIADTQALARGAVGVTFGDMKVASASIRAVDPLDWKLNGAIVLDLNTTYSDARAKKLSIGLLADTDGTIKIVAAGGQLKPLDAIGIRASLDGDLGAPYKPLLDKATAQQPSPYKTLMTVLQGIAAKYKATGLAAPLK
jgi:hypothetical protein